MRCPALTVLFAGFLVVALVAGAGAASSDVTGLAGSTTGFDGVGGTVADPAVSQSVDAGFDTGDMGHQTVESSTLPDGVETSRIATAGTFNVEFTPSAETEIRIHLDPDRDARWEVVVRYVFTDANETAVFEEVGERFLDEELGPSVTPFEGYADGANEVVDRDMRIEEVDREVVVSDDPSASDVADDDAIAVGELRLEFTWTEFLERDGENLVLGDALATPSGGTWLRSIEAGQSIEVKTPAGYTVSGTPGATLPLRDNAVILDGPRAFDEDERVAVVYSPTAGPEAPPWTLLAGAIVLAALLIAAGLVGYRRFGESDSTAEGADPDARDSDPSDPDSQSVGGTDAESTEEDLSLLSDEERVERLLRRHGGRMRQADIVSETGWSDAKVSQLLSAMAANGRVEKLRLGRENLISVPEYDSDSGSEGDGNDGNDGDDDDDDPTDRDRTSHGRS